MGGRQSTIHPLPFSTILVQPMPLAAKYQIQFDNETFLTPQDEARNVLKTVLKNHNSGNKFAIYPFEF